MAQIEVKVKLDLPPGVELLGYERCGDGHGFDEISLKKRHKLYVTLMTDLTDPELPKVLAVAKGRDTVAAKQCSCSKIAPGSTCALVELDCRGVKTTSAYCKLEL